MASETIVAACVACEDIRYPLYDLTINTLATYLQNFL